MREKENIFHIGRLGPDYMGFVFYPPSRRYANLPPADIRLPSDVKRAGVFVDEERGVMVRVAREYGLHVIQLHGAEHPEVCHELRQEGFNVIKAFHVSGSFDFEVTRAYRKACDYFLFDTAHEQSRGGTGKKFDWNILRDYDNEVPFFLSGGIGPEDADDLDRLSHLNIHAADINSRFEDRTGLKNVNKISVFINKLLNKAI